MNYKSRPKKASKVVANHDSTIKPSSKSHKRSVRSQRLQTAGAVVSKASDVFFALPGIISILAFAMFLIFLKSPTVPFSAESIFNAISSVPAFPELTVDMTSYFATAGASDTFLHTMDAIASVIAGFVNVFVYLFNLLVWVFKVIITLFGGNVL